MRSPRSGLCRPFPAVWIRISFLWKQSCANLCAPTVWLDLVLDAATSGRRVISILGDSCMPGHCLILPPLLFWRSCRPASAGGLVAAYANLVAVSTIRLIQLAPRCGRRRGRAIVTVWLSSVCGAFYREAHCLHFNWLLPPHLLFSWSSHLQPGR